MATITTIGLDSAKSVFQVHGVVIAGGLFAFAVSFDQFVVSYFLSTPGEDTLPVEIYAGETMKVLIQNSGYERPNEGDDVILQWTSESTVLLT